MALIENVKKTMKEREINKKNEWNYVNEEDKERETKYKVKMVLIESGKNEVKWMKLHKWIIKPAGLKLERQ